MPLLVLLTNDAARDLDEIYDYMDSNFKPSFSAF
jgi:plasmid stabilization system protein ParE